MKLLDCTLRDGAHVTKGFFGRDVAISIIDHLARANVDIIEIGFLQNCIYDVDKVFFPSFKEVDDLLKDVPNIDSLGSRLSVMARPDRIDINSLKYKSKYIDTIRIAFYYDMIDSVEECAEIL